MKKINHIKQLKEKQRMIRRHGEQLEIAISQNWEELKNTIRPGNLAKGLFKDWLEKKNQPTFNRSNILSGGLTLGAGLLAGKLLGIAGKKLLKVLI